jgi:hypothetical protein
MAHAHDPSAQEAVRQHAAHEARAAHTEGHRPAHKDGPFTLTQKGSVTPRSHKLPPIDEVQEKPKPVKIPRGGSASFTASAGLSSGLKGAYSLSVTSPTTHVGVTALPGSTVAVGKESEPFTLTVADAAPLGDTVVTVEANDGDHKRTASIHVTVTE